MALSTPTLSIAGDVFTPSDAGYDEARRVWNGTIDRRPALIARPRGAADVAEAIRFARAHDLPIAVRGGGHNVAGTAVADGALVIDLVAMDGVRVDPAWRTVWVQAGATWGAVDRETQLYGLATPGGVVATTGVAGLALSGGYSHQRRRDGMTIDNVLAVELVTADGEVLRASATEHPDLFWALRGGGGNFGVVTAFELRLHELGPEVVYLNVAYPIERTAEIGRAYRALVADAPDELTADLVVWTLPDGRPFVGIAGMYAGPVADGWKAIEPMRRLGEPLADESVAVPYVALQSSLDPLFPSGLRYFWKSLYLDALTDEAIDRIAEVGAHRSSPRTLIILRLLGGAIDRVAPDATPFGARGAQFLLSIDSTWEDPAEDAGHAAWTRAAWDSFAAREGSRSYLNFASDQDGDVVRAAHGANFARLAEVKRRYDAGNVFRINPNVVPEN